ncbi:hypothetical protein ACOME3_010751 [Neoechinorhynchus agilis]
MSSSDSEVHNGDITEETFDGFNLGSIGYEQYKWKCALFSLLPCISLLWMFNSIIHLELLNHLFLYAIGTIATFVCLNLSYKEATEHLKFRIAQKRQDSLNRYITDNVLTAKERKMMKREKEEIMIVRKRELVDYEAALLSVAVVNSLLVVSSTFLGLLLFRGSAPGFNYFVTTLVAGFLTFGYTKSGSPLWFI